MAELANRDEIEQRFARRVKDLTAKQRAELLRLLGTPPDPRNVPDSFWQQVERQIEEELLLVLLLIFATSAVQHGIDLAKAREGGKDWSAKRAKEVAKGFTDHTRERLQKAGERWEQQREKAREKARAEADAGGADGADTTGDATGGATGGDIATAVPSPEEIAADIESMFSPERAEGLAVSETTTGASAGSEFAATTAGTAADDDTWFTAHDQRVCPVCAPLHGTRRSNWTRFFPSGPPAHPWCRCWIEYAAPATPPTPPQQPTP